MKSGQFRFGRQAAFMIGIKLNLDRPDIEMGQRTQSRL
jgi:hypothetical protein